jgi:hypothetical protein
MEKEGDASLTKIIVSHNLLRVKALMQNLGDKKSIRQAVARSIKRTLPAIQRIAIRETRAKKMLKMSASDMKYRVRAYLRIGNHIPVDELQGKLWISPKEENLALFYSRRIVAGRSKSLAKRGGWQGVRLYGVKVNKYGAPYLKNPKHTFQVLKGFRGGGRVFERLSSAKRLPIFSLDGPAVADLVQKEGIFAKIVDVATERYEREFLHNVDFYAKRAIARALEKK